MEIRKATASDAEDILRLLIQVNNVHADIRPDYFIKDKTKYTASELAPLLEDESRPVFLCVDSSGELAGYGFCVISSQQGANLVPFKTIYIDDICVDAAFRRRGVATMIYDHIIAYAKEIGCYNVTLNVWEGNDSALAFYESRGMKVLKTTMETIV